MTSSDRQTCPKKPLLLADVGAGAGMCAGSGVGAPAGTVSAVRHVAHTVNNLK